MNINPMMRTTTALFALGLGLAGCQTTVTQEQVQQMQAEQRDLSTLLLTWQRDPSSTMTIQWLEEQAELDLAEGQAEPGPAPTAIPDVGSVALDAEGPAWIEQALELRFLADDEHATPDPDDLSADAWLAWNEQGILVYVDVRDDAFVESDDDEALWQGDGIELFVSEQVGSGERYQLIITPGADPEQPEPRHQFIDRRDAHDTTLELEYDVAVDEQGYRMAALLPWTNLRTQAERGEQLGFQIFVNDRDDRESDDAQLITWHPSHDTSNNTHSHKAVELADEAGSPVTARLVTDRYRDENIVEVFATPERRGERVSIYATDERVGSGTLRRHGNVTRARVSVDAPPAGHRWGTLHAYLDDQRLASADAPGEASYDPVDPVRLAYFPYGADQGWLVTTQVHEVRQWPGMFLHRVELTGLDPDTAYQFQVDGYHRTLAFYTMPETQTRPIRFATGGDVRHRKEWMLRTNRVAMEHNPEFIVWGGDLAYADGREDRVHRWEEWFNANYQTLIDDAGFVTPVIVGIGNHEVKSGYYHRHDDYEQTDAFRESIAPYFYSFFPFPGQPGYNTLDFGDYISFISLDTEHTNPVEGDQTDWLAMALAERQHVPHVFPFYHVASFPSHRNYDGGVMRRIRENWVPLFEDYNVRVVFENHDHTYKRTPRIRNLEIDDTGIVYIGDGAWGVNTRSVHDPDETWYLEKAKSIRHAIIVTIDGDRQQHDVYSEDSELIDQYTDERD